MKGRACKMSQYILSICESKYLKHFHICRQGLNDQWVGKPLVLLPIPPLKLPFPPVQYEITITVEISNNLA